MQVNKRQIISVLILGFRKAYSFANILRSALYLLHCSWRLLRCYDEKIMLL